jgi:metallo-beta-lactamase family protein
MKLQIHGAAREVTGSMFLLETGTHRLLIDCGLIQGSPRDEARNRDRFPFDPASLDAVILTHAHLDHSGRLPRLVRAGFRGHIHTHPASADLAAILLKDAALLAERDALQDNRKRERRGQKPVEPLTTRREAEAVLKRFRTHEYLTPAGVLPGVRLTLHDAGHILGSAIVELEVQDARRTRRLVFSGDLGHRGAPILRDPARLHKADLVVMEATYGDRLHRRWPDTVREMGEIFTEAGAGGGNILVPTFAIGRAQELLYLFQQHVHDWGLERWAIFLDSPMAIEATEVYARHWRLYDEEAAGRRRRNGNVFGLPNLRLSHTPAQSMAINRLRAGAVILAGSGMCDGGRIRHHFKHNLWREQCHVVFTGFQARGTLGRELVDGARQIRLWGETIRVAARIHTVGGLSAHADRQDLLDWYRAFRQRPSLVLVHGEMPALTVLAKTLEREARAPVRVAAPGEVIAVE